MKVYVKNKLFSIRGSSTVKDENQNDVFTVKGKVFSFTRKKFICDVNGNRLYTVRNKLINFFYHKAYLYDGNGNKIACIKHPPFSKRFEVDGYKDNIVVDGEFFSFESRVTRNGLTIGTITRKIDWTDSFCIEGNPPDIPFLIALVIAIDIVTDKIRSSY